MRTNILITGGTGFIGSHLITKLLECERYSIHSASRRKAQAYPESNYFRQHLLTTQEGIEKIFLNHEIHVVIHLCTHYEHELTNTNIGDLLESNIAFGARLLKAMLDNGCTRMINTTSVAEFSCDGSYAPNSFYAATKRAFRDLCLFFKEVKKFTVTDLALYDNYGPQDNRRKITNILCENLDKRKILELSPGKQHLNLVHVSDTISAIENVLTAHLQHNFNEFDLNNLYCVRPDKSLTIRQLSKRIESLSGKLLNINWGALPYRNNTVFTPWQGPILPNWKPQITIDDGLLELLNLNTK